MVNEINVDDINYAIYTVGSWKNNYKINQVGISNEIPATEATIHHVKLSMGEIRAAVSDLGDYKVNGLIAIAYVLNPSIHEMDIKDIIKLEEEEFNKITEELNNLEVLSEGTIPLDTEDYLIYKLEKECHVTKSVPANDFTRKYQEEELKKIKESLS